jgi:hypothetical protein
MSYPSIDSLQKALGSEFFDNRQDIKKAAGRAMGTVVELITFYVLRQWGLLPHLTIERGLAEFANEAITHNVEFGIHPIHASHRVSLPSRLPVSTSSILKASKGGKGLPSELTRHFNSDHHKATQLLSAYQVLRNACTVAESEHNLLIANLVDYSGEGVIADFALLAPSPFAMVECKRVGVEDGARKGPTTIEKAKQGAYVAKHVSALQKVRGRDGKLYGVMPLREGRFQIRELTEEIRRLVFDAPKEELDGFTLTVGVVSNHGNWFTRGDPNKELAVLQQSYDWLLFLSDAGIVEFVQDTILAPSPGLQPVKDAFEASYRSGVSGSNQCTKVKIALPAHRALVEYFEKNIAKIESTWFSVLAPSVGELNDLRSELAALAKRFGT